MINSKEKQEDIKLREQFLYLIRSALRAYESNGNQFDYEMAKSFGEKARKLKQRVESEDYTEREQKRRRIDKKIQPLTKE